MPRSLKSAASPSLELRNFTNRENERDVFRGLLDLPAGTPLPALMFYGVGGTGKSWLLRKLREELGATAPSALLDFEPLSGGTPYHADSARSLVELRRQLETVGCPQFDLAYSWLRHKEGGGDEPLLRGSGVASATFELVKAGAGVLIAEVPGSKLVTWLAGKVAKPVWNRVKGTRLEHWLASRVGQEDFQRLRRMNAQEIYPILGERLMRDLSENLPERDGKACRGVMFLDTYEALRQGVTGDALAHAREEWVRNLHYADAGVLLVMAGRDRLRWEECDADYHKRELLEQHLVGGLSEEDARLFLTKCGIADGAVQDAVLRVAVDTETAAEHGRRGHHPFSLGLCADTVLNVRASQREVDAAPFDMAPGDTGRLAQRFLKSLNDPAHEVWVKRLALTPRFEETAARAAFSPVHDVAQDAAWLTLRNYSFVRDTDQPGWWTLHARMRDALAEMHGAATGNHQFWMEHWQKRTQADCDEFAGLVWYHRYCLDPTTAAVDWNERAEKARRECRMTDHEHLLGWWEPTELESKRVHSPDEAGRLRILGMAALVTTRGNRTAVLRRAIACFVTALRSYTEFEFPAQWGEIQNSLGKAYTLLPTGEHSENLRRAVTHYEAALCVRTQTGAPEQWATTQIDLGNALAHLSVGDRGENMRKAIACYEAALTFFTEADYPAEWARTQTNLGVVYLDLPMGDRVDNLRRAIEYLQSALRINNENDFPAHWALNQNNLGVAWANLAAGDRGENLRRAIGCYEAAVRIHTEIEYPFHWALAQNNLGEAWRLMPVGQREDNLRLSFFYLQAALRVFTEADFPAHWAEVHNELGKSYAIFPIGNRCENMKLAIVSYEASLRVRTEAEFPADWAATQTDMGLAYRQLTDLTGQAADHQRAINCFSAAARTYLRMGMEEKANSALQLAQELQDSPPGL